MDESPTFVTLPDGGVLAYHLFGQEHLNHRRPLVLVCGMNSVKQDWERLSVVLARRLPVLVYDHRGIGDSKFSHPEADEISVESTARDLNFLIDWQNWKEVDICGTSMGGIVVQQLLFLPHHPTAPTPLRFRICHVVLAATTPCILEVSPGGFKLPSDPAVIAKMKPEVVERINRMVLEANFDTEWVEGAGNHERLKWWANRNPEHRPIPTILKQAEALRTFDFQTLHSNLPPTLPVLIIHGEFDSILPFSAGQDLLSRIPSARMVPMGSGPGEIPHYQFGHVWWEYFSPETWHDVFERFLDDENLDGASGSGYVKARL